MTLQPVFHLSNEMRGPSQGIYANCFSVQAVPIHQACAGVDSLNLLQHQHQASLRHSRQHLRGHRNFLCLRRSIGPTPSSALTAELRLLLHQS